MRHAVSSLLSRLEELHVHWPAYTAQMDQLQEWCIQAHTALAAISLDDPHNQCINDNFNQIWVSCLNERVFTVSVIVLYCVCSK